MIISPTRKIFYSISFFNGFILFKFKHLYGFLLVIMFDCVEHMFSYMRM